MKNFTIAIAMLLVMASFTTNLTNSTSAVLSDYEGTLLKSAPVLENNDGDVKVTFTVDQNVMVSSCFDWFFKRDLSSGKWGFRLIKNRDTRS